MPRQYLGTVIYVGRGPRKCRWRSKGNEMGRENHAVVEVNYRGCTPPPVHISALIYILYGNSIAWIRCSWVVEICEDSYGLLNSLSRYNSHGIRFIQVKYTIQCFSLHSKSCVTIPVSVRTFSSLQKETTGSIAIIFLFHSLTRLCRTKQPLKFV